MRVAFAPLRHRPFRFLIAARVVNRWGNAIGPVALAFAVLRDLDGSAADLGLVVGAHSVTHLLFLLIGGVVADRLPRAAVMVVSSGLAGASQAVVAALVLTHTATVPALAALSALHGAVAAFAMPASAALLPQTVPADLRKAANALSRLLLTTATTIGLAFGGVLVATIGSGWGLAVDAATFIASAGLFALVRVPATVEHRPAADAPTPTGSLWGGLAGGWWEFRSRTWLWVVVLGFCFWNAAFAAVFSVLGPVVANDTFGPAGWGLVLAVEAVGMAAGALFAMRIRARRLLLVGVACCAAWVPALGALGLGAGLAALLPLALLAGATIQQFAIAWETSMQEHVPPDRLARVYSYDMLGSFLAIPVGQAAAGPLAALVGTPGAILLAAGVMAAATLGMLSSRAVRTLPHNPAPATAG